MCPQVGFHRRLTGSNSRQLQAKQTGPDNQQPHCRSYSPLPVRFKTVKPAFLASDIESGFSFTGEWNGEMIFRTGFLQAGH